MADYLFLLHHKNYLLLRLKYTYNLFDIAIDHELRHAVEWRLKNTKKGLMTKIGCDIFNFSFMEMIL